MTQKELGVLDDILSVMNIKYQENNKTSTIKDEMYNQLKNGKFKSSEEFKKNPEYYFNRLVKDNHLNNGPNSSFGQIYSLTPEGIKIASSSFGYVDEFLDKAWRQEKEQNKQRTKEQKEEELRQSIIDTNTSVKLTNEAIRKNAFWSILFAVLTFLAILAQAYFMYLQLK